MSKILVTGGGRGLGRHLVSYTKAHGHDVYIYDTQYNTRDDVRRPVDMDFLGGELDVLINCAGVESVSYIEDLEKAKFYNCIDVNAWGILAMTKACLPMLKKSRGTILNIISSAADVPMTASIAYNASKAAAKMMTRQMARELTRRHQITVFGVSPNRLAGTAMSIRVDKQVAAVRGWTQEETQAKQTEGMLCGETPPERVAEFIAFLLKNKANHQHLSGCVIPYGV